jgi:glucokinase
MNEWFIGVEIGASKIQTALGDGEGNLLYNRRYDVVLQDGAEGILSRLKSEIPEAIEYARTKGAVVKGIGVGFGGILETATGRSLASVQVEGWKDFPVKDWFEKQFGLPVLVLNDTVAGGYGEYYCAGDRKAAVYFYTNIGSGIGGCLLYKGRYYDGAGFGGAYFGHTYIPDPFAASPGTFAKVETLCSGFGIERRLNSSGYVPETSLLYTLASGGPCNCAMLGEAAGKGDAFALAEIDRIADSYALGLSNVITLFGVQQVVIGGGVVKLGELLLGPIRTYTEKYVFFSAAGRYTITRSRLMDDAVLAGAIVAASGRVSAIE